MVADPNRNNLAQDDDLTEPIFIHPAVDKHNSRLQDDVAFYDASARSFEELITALTSFEVLLAQCAINNPKAMATVQTAYAKFLIIQDLRMSQDIADSFNVDVSAVTKTHTINKGHMTINISINK